MLEAGQGSRSWVVTWEQAARACSNSSYSAATISSRPCSARASWPRRRSSWPWSRSCGPWCGPGFEGKERPRESDRRPADRVDAEAAHGTDQPQPRAVAGDLPGRPRRRQAGRSGVAAIGHDTPSAVGQGASRSAPLDPDGGAARRPDCRQPGPLRPGSEGPQVASSERRDYRQTPGHAVQRRRTRGSRREQPAERSAAGCSATTQPAQRRCLPDRSMRSSVHTPRPRARRRTRRPPTGVAQAGRSARVGTSGRRPRASSPRRQGPSRHRVPTRRPAGRIGQSPAEASRRPRIPLIPPRSPTCAGD